jgi:uncharacterized protein
MNDPNATPTAVRERTLTVVGHGSVSATPDIATINVGIETRASTAAEASRRNNERMNAIVARLQELGIAEKDMQTSRYSLNLERSKPAGQESARLRYHVSNALWIKIRDLSRVSATLDALTAAGANQVWGVFFGIDDPAPLKAQARARAVEDARACAEDLARLAGVQLGPVLAVSEIAGARPAEPYGTSFAMLRLEQAGPHISAGETEEAYQVQVTFAIR